MQVIENATKADNSLSGNKSYVLGKKLKSISLMILG